MGVARNFFLELLCVLAELLECNGGFGYFFGDDGTLLRRDLLRLAIGGCKLVNGALRNMSTAATAKGAKGEREKSSTMDGLSACLLALYIEFERVTERQIR